jgi:predicted dehydrogenase
VELIGVFEPDAERRRELEHSDGPYQGVRWFHDRDEMLGDPSIVAIASEGLPRESLEQTEAILKAGKHVWYDKPAGDHWAQWQQAIALAEESHLHIQMGYMFRYHDGFRRIGQWIESKLLGDVFAIRIHMSSRISPAQRRLLSHHAGGIFFELGCHVLDQIVWWLGRPRKVTAFLRNDGGVISEFHDNTITVFEYSKAMAVVEIAALEVGASASRRIEVYGSRGSAIMQPLEPAKSVWLCLEEAQAPYRQGAQSIPLEEQSRQTLYDLELAAFVATLLGEQPPARPLSHELLVQETLLRATGRLLDPI